MFITKKKFADAIENAVNNARDEYYREERRRRTDDNMWKRISEAEDRILKLEKVTGLSEEEKRCPYMNNLINASDI